MADPRNYLPGQERKQGIDGRQQAEEKVSFVSAARKGRIHSMRIDKIKIFPCFEKQSPKAEKMEQKEKYFQRTGEFESQIVLDIAGNMIDGYTTYLLARKYGLERISIRYGRRQIITASHRPGGKLYSWELPGILVGRVHVGDRVVVRTKKGYAVVKVAAVEEYAGQEPEPLRMVVRRCGIRLQTQ